MCSFARARAVPSPRRPGCISTAASPAEVARQRVLPAFATDRLPATARRFIDIVLLPMVLRALLGEEGVFAGVSAGAVVHVARKLAGELDEGVVVAILADAGWKYLSAPFWDAEDPEAAMEADLWW